MPRRELAFTDFAAVLADIDHLLRGGYNRAGQWDLAQVCDHLSYFIEASLDGARFRVPWILKVLFGKLVLRRILKKRRMKAGVFTPQNPLPASGGDELAAVARLRKAIELFQAHKGEFHDSPFFGHLTPQQWRELHLIHCSHHLGFLSPKSSGV